MTPSLPITPPHVMVGDITNDGISDTIYLAAGCYWGTQKYVQENFQKLYPHTIKSVRVGLMHPNETEVKKGVPSYSKVCTGSTGYIEAVQIIFKDPSPKLFEDLIKYFFQFHDPTTKDRQGYHVGTQYGSHIFVTDEAQKIIACKVLDKVKLLVKTGKIRAFKSTTVHTCVHESTTFHEAQKNYEKNASDYCSHFIRFHVWPNSS